MKFWRSTRLVGRTYKALDQLLVSLTAPGEFLQRPFDVEFYHYAAKIENNPLNIV